MSISLQKSDKNKRKEGIKLLRVIRHLSAKKNSLPDLVQDLNNGRVFVISSFPRQKQLNENEINPRDYFAKYASFRHPTIVSFHPDILPDFSNPQVIRYAIPYYTHGSLESMLLSESRGTHPKEYNSTAKSMICFGLAYALKILHSQNMFHGVMTTSHVLLSHSLHPALSGYWLRELCDPSYFEHPEKKSFLPTDILEKPSTKTDIFSYGAILCCLIRHTTMYNGHPDNPNIPDLLRDLIKKCLDNEPTSRPTIDDILSQIVNGPAVFSNTDSSQFQTYVNWLNNIQIEKPIYNPTELMKFADDKEMANAYKDLADRGNIVAHLINGVNKREGKGCSVNRNAALRSFKTAADGGIPEAQYHASVIMSNKPKNAQVRHEANQYLKKAADNGFIEAEYRYGLMMSRGDVTMKPDKKQAEQYLRSAAEKGNINAQKLISEMYISGALGVYNSEEGYKFLKLAAYNGDVESELNYVKHLKSKKDSSNYQNEINDLLYRAALAGNKDAQIQIATLITQGKCHLDNIEDEYKFVQIAAQDGQKDVCNYFANLVVDNKVKLDNKAEEFKYIKLAAENGNDKALYQCGLALIAQRNNKKDVELGLKYLKKSATEFKNPNSAYSYASYIIGSNTSMWPEEAEELMKLAAENGVTEAKTSLAKYLKEKDPQIAQKYNENDENLKLPGDQLFENAIKRLSSEQNLEKETGILYLKTAADKGFATAQRMYAAYILHGKCEKGDEQQYAKYYKLAADQGDAFAMARYGELLSDGDGVEMNAQEAFKYFEKAAAAGNGRAMYSLGLMYEIGDGCNKDIKKALEYMEKATQASPPFKKAKKELKRMEAHESVFEEPSDFLTPEEPSDDEDEEGDLKYFFKDDEDYEEDYDEADDSDTDDYGADFDNNNRGGDSDSDKFELFKPNKEMDIVVD